jgi:NDP-sugar pyrophosphorylase family protein
MAPLGDSTLILNGIKRILPRIPKVHVTVGYKARMLAEHVIEEGISSVISTEGKGNAWWLFNSLISHLDSPVVVLTCDNLTDLDFDRLYSDYRQLGSPPCMVIPVKPVTGLDGDYIFQENQTVTRLDRNSPSDTYCSGIQVINPKIVNELVEPDEDFLGVWDQLIRLRQLKVSTVLPTRWFTVDTINSLSEANHHFE